MLVYQRVTTGCGYHAKPTSSSDEIPDTAQEIGIGSQRRSRSIAMPSGSHGYGVGRVGIAPRISWLGMGQHRVRPQNGIATIYVYMEYI